MKCFGLLFWLLLGLTAATHAQRPPAHPPLVVILLPGTSLQGWQTADAPYLHQLMISGALAVMNTRTARLANDHTRESPESAVLTLGAGARAAGGPEATAFLRPTEAVPDLRVSASDLDVRRTGSRPLPSRSVNVSWPDILRTNARLGYHLRLGLLADALAAKGVPFVAGGGPFADCAAAASDGTVRITPVLNVTAGQCLVWDAGSDIPAADGVIGSAAAQVARLRGRLIILSPFAGDRDYAQGRRLTPLLEWGEGIAPGLLRSPSTRRVGLVVNTDFAPTVGAYFGIRREQFPVRPFGEEWNNIAAPDAQGQVSALEEQAVRQAAGMKVLPYIAVTLAIWMIGGTALALLMRLPRVWPVVPLALVVALVFSSTKLSLFVLFGLLLAPALPLAERLGPRRIALVLLTILAAALILDMLTGSRLMQRGMLGYSAVEGARYYGIGNEAMGVLVGALLVLAARLWSRFGRAGWTLLLLLGSVALLLGSANVGAKAGGLLVSLVAFGSLAFGLLVGRWSVRTVLVLGVSAVAAVAIAAIGDAIVWHGSNSHMGEAVRRIQSSGWSEAGDIISRKMAVEGRLAYHSAWALTLWAGLLCLSLLWRRQAAGTQEEQALRIAGMAGIIACIALNDAGVVAGALCLIPLWCDSTAAVTKRKPLEQQKLFQGRSLRSGTY